MSYQVEVDFGSGWVDISTKLYGRLPVSSTRSIHKSLRPVIDTARFKIVRDQTLINQFLSATSDVPVRIHKDTSDYFTGIIRPTHKAKIGHIRAESFAVECVDAWYTLDRTFTGAPFVMRSCNVSNPTTKASSILHQLFYRAGFADALLSLDAIAISVAAFTVDTATGSAPTFRKIIEQLISENGHTAYVDESGIVHLYNLGPSTITPSGSFSSGSAGNIAEGYEIDRREESVEAVDVSYYPPKTMTAQVVFADTTGGTDLQEATIVIAPGGYYPQGADATHSVDAEFKIDNYEIIDTQSAALVVEVSAGSVPATQVFTAESKKAKLRLYSSGGCTIKKLNITGTATVKGDLGKAIRENVALTTKREQITLDYMGDSATAERVSILRANWHRDAAYEYSFECTDLAVKPGDYRTFSELAIMGISTTVRVVNVDHGSNEKTVKVSVEAVSAFAVVPVVTESQVISRPRGLQGVDGTDGTNGVNGTRTASIELYKWAASAPTGTWPVGTSTYTWATGAFTAPATLNGWSIVPPAAVAGQTLYQVRAVYADTNTSATSTITWPASPTPEPISLAGTNGTNGANGARTAVLEMYKWSASTPTTWPSGSSTYTWATGLFTAPATPNGWSISPGAAVVGQKLYATRVIFSDTDTSATDSVTWPASAQVAYEVGYAGTNGTDGTNGVNGTRTASIELYKWAASAPTGTWPVGTSTYTWATGAFTAPATLNGWSIVPPAAVAGQTLYQVRAVYADTNTSATSTITWPASPTPEPISLAGTNGTNGKTYALNIIGGKRAIAYNAAGTTPVPAMTAFTCELYEDGVAKTPATWAWSVPAANSLLSGSSATASFTPTVAGTFVAASADNAVFLTVTYAGQTIKAAVPVAMVKVGDTGATGNTGAGAWTPVMAGGIAAINSTTFKKSTGTAGWNAAVHSTEGFKSCSLKFMASQVNKAIMFGIDQVPTTDLTYTSIDHCFYLMSTGAIYIYESNVSTNLSMSYTTSTVFKITYDGTNVRYYVDDVLKKTTLNAAKTFYLDSSFNETLGEINSVVWGQMFSGVEIVAGSIKTDNLESGAINASVIAAGTITGDRLAAAAVTADKINVTDLFAEDIDATGSISGAKIRSYQGQGVQRRAVQVYNEALDWINTPVSGSELLVARIGRLGVGSDQILLDGDFVMINDAAYWYDQTTINAASSYDPAFIQMSDGTIRIAYCKTSNTYLVERIWSGTAWGAESTINAALSGAPKYIQQGNGTLRVAYRNSSLNIVERIWSGSAWGSESLIDSGSFTPAYVEMSDATLRIAYRDSAASNLKEKIWSGSAWGTETTINAATSYDPSYIQRADGELRICYTNSSYYTVERIWNGSAWGSETVIHNASQSYDPVYVETLTGQLSVFYTKNNGNLIQRIWSGTAWGAEVIVDSSGYSSASHCIQLQDGQLRIAYIGLSNYVYERTLDRYQSLAYPQSGYVAGRGWWKKDADGTLTQWWFNATAFSVPAGGSETFYTYPIPFIGTFPAVAGGAGPLSGWTGVSVTVVAYDSLSRCTIHINSDILQNFFNLGYIAIGRWK